MASWDIDDGSWLNPVDVIQKEMNNSQEEKGEIEMILYKVTDGKSKMNGSIWLFNGEQLTRLDGTSAAKLGQSLKTVDINQAEMSSFKNIGIRTVGDFQY